MTRPVEYSPRSRREPVNENLLHRAKDAKGNSLGAKRMAQSVSESAD